MAEQRKPHAIMFPLPHQGHINPCMNLALKLASKGFVVTFVNLEFVHHMMSKSHGTNTSDDHYKEFDLFPGARESGLEIRCATISEGFPLEFDRVLNLQEFWETMLRDFPARVDEFVGDLLMKSDPNLEHLLIVDTFYSWSGKIARKYNLVTVSFWTEPALVFSLTYHSQLLREKGHYPCKDGVEEEINYIPGIESVNTRDLMPYLRESDVNTISFKLVAAAFNDVKNADFILHNTLQELESGILSALNKHQPNYAIGPINFSKNVITPNGVSKSLWSESDCTHWLESRTPGSVLYVSFGSLVQTSKQVIEEIANGLLLSGVNFIWVIRPGVAGADDSNALPSGFEDEIIKDKGLIIPWSDQVKVLSNPAVGGFLTHCGWNSVLESIWCGAPMICYPVDYDQPMNRKLVVYDWKIGLNLYDGKFVERKEVAEKIKNLMSGSVSERLREEIKKFNLMLRNAVEENGSLERNFDQFIKDLKAKIDEKNTNV